VNVYNHGTCFNTFSGGLVRWHSLNRFGSRACALAKSRPHAVVCRDRGRRNALRRALCAPAQKAPYSATSRTSAPLHSYMLALLCFARTGSTVGFSLMLGQHLLTMLFLGIPRDKGEYGRFNGS